MTLVRRLVCCALVAALCGLAVGCQMFPSSMRSPRGMKVPTFGEVLHELQPHRLHRWNRQPPPSRDTNW